MGIRLVHTILPLVLVAGASVRPVPALADDASQSAAIVERWGCLGCPSYEVEIHADGRVIWNGQEDVAVVGRAEGRGDPAGIAALFRDFFPKSESEICIEEPGVDTPVRFVLFSRTGSLDELRKQRDDLFRRRQSDPTLQEPCSIFGRFDEALTKLEKAADSHQWLHGRESILDRAKVSEDINFGIKPGFSETMQASGKGNLQEVAAFLQTERPDRTDETGWTALIVASSQCRTEVVTKLLSAGADPNSQDTNGDTPLIAAASSECWRSDPDEEPGAHYDLIAQLVAAGGHVNQSDQAGATPLMVAARFANPDSVKALLASGANPNLRDKSGATAMGYTDKYARDVSGYARSAQPEYFRRFRKVSKLLSQALAQSSRKQ